ncbi:hypothetical protein [Nitrosovibrio sp. Nv6]|uniref:hypothetical protein n=1 Tax=Nitrosovibrio sp. Nv6 TaxID=1855340 RepID=UPI0008B08A14|nr:hypothetical protein [Nitrosovibrio sp. Nv6]SEO79017.1 hypothetical protein SAMN05216316_1108 [Nitrosovibrio sp. Nv6]
MTALEALNWHSDSALSPSDETILAQRERFSVVESRPEPLSMTDPERWEWFKEYCDNYKYVRPTKTTLGRHVIICDGEETSAANFNDAVDLAASKHKEINR